MLNFSYFVKMVIIYFTLITYSASIFSMKCHLSSTIENLIYARAKRICYFRANAMIYNLAPVRWGCILSTMEWNNPSTWHNCCRDYEINCQVSSYQFFGTYYLRQLFNEPLSSNVDQKYIRMKLLFILLVIKQEPCIKMYLENSFSIWFEMKTFAYNLIFYYSLYFF